MFKSAVLKFAAFTSRSLQYESMLSKFLFSLPGNVLTICLIFALGVHFAQGQAVSKEIGLSSLFLK